jgi:6-phosphogluconolactonase
MVKTSPAVHFSRRVAFRIVAGSLIVMVWLTEIQTISTLPEGFSATNSGAEIVVDRAGKFLYISNHGDDSIVVFSINPAEGTLTKIQRVTTQGKTPRSFSIDPTGGFLLAANLDSSRVTVFQINAATGELYPVGKSLNMPTPVCVVLVPADLY